MDIKRNCVLCGSTFRTGNGKAKYCSDKCRKEAHSQKQKEWRKEHPDYQREWRSRHDTQ